MFFYLNIYLEGQQLILITICDIQKPFWGGGGSYSEVQ